MNRASRFLNDIWEKGFFHLLTSNLLMQVVGFGSQLFVAWILPPEDVGRIRIMQTFVGLAVIVAGLGFNTSVLKLCSESRPAGEKKYLFRRAVVYTWVACLPVYGVIVGCSHGNMFSTDHTINALLPLFGIALIPQVVNQVMVVYLQALKYFKEIAAIQILSKFISIGLIIGATWVWGLMGFVLASLGGMLFSAGFAQWRVNRLHLHVETTATDRPFRQHWYYARFSFLANTIGQISLYLDLYLINYLIEDKEQVGYYGFAVTLMLALHLITWTVQQAVTPYFSEKAPHGQEFLRVYRKYSRLFMIVSAACATAGITLVPPIIHWIFRGKYDASMVYFQLLTIGWFVRNLFALKGVALLGMGKIHLNFYSVLLALPISVFSTFVLIRHFGMVGASYGIIVGAAVTWTIVGLQLRRVLTGLKVQGT
jgi:O-antigen/teichoic acid export membrane protein